MFKKIMVLLIFIGINFSRFYMRFVIILLYFGVFVLRLVLSIIFNSCGIYIYCWGNSLVFWRFWGDSDIC